VRRISSGVPELDAVLGGGLEPGSLIVVSGSPGTGKTILAQQICFANATPQNKTIYYTTLAEPQVKLLRHMEQFDFCDSGALGRAVEFIHLGDLVNEGGEAPLAPIVTEVVRKCIDDQPAAVVIDTSRALHDFVDERTLRRALYDMASRISHTGTVLILVGEYTLEEHNGPEFALADGIIELAYDAAEPVDRRWLRVTKMRGARPLEGKHSFQITSKGIEIFPRLETMAPQDSPGLSHGERIEIGVQKLDEMMGGGIRRTDATALMGPSGCGKTALSLHYIDRGLKDEERALYISFQETEDQLLAKAASLGIDLEAALSSGQLVVHHVPQGRLDLDAIGTVLRNELATGSVRRVVFDSLAEMVMAAREGHRFPAYARSLMGIIRGAGASVVITSETTTLGPEHEASGGLSFLFQNVVLLRYIEIESEIRRALAVVKMRDSTHVKGLVQFEIDDTGFRVMKKLEGITGILGWSALRSSEAAVGGLEPTEIG
jgi:circadian clock protein KaiC